MAAACMAWSAPVAIPTQTVCSAATTTITAATSNLSRALAAARGIDVREAEFAVHDVMNVFMCTGFTRDTHKYFMKATPVRPGDFIEFFAEIDLLAVLSACPGGDCSSEHSSDAARCYPLKVEIYRPDPSFLLNWQACTASAYDRTHGLG
jgi:uncharacterized protein